MATIALLPRLVAASPEAFAPGSERLQQTTAHLLSSLVRARVRVRVCP